MLPQHQLRLANAQAFLFDFHGTLALFDHAPKPLWQLLNDMGYRSSHHLQAIWDSDAFDGLLTPGGATDPNYEAWRLDNLKQFARLSGVPQPLLDQTVAAMLQHVQTATFKPIAGAGALLRFLEQKGRRLAICSNWDYHLHDILARFGFPPFDAVAISWEVGARKPNAAIFQHACAELQVSPASAVHVGDSWSADIIGALRAGLLPIWIHPDAPTNPLPHHVPAFTTLQQLTSAAKQLL